MNDGLVSFLMSKHRMTRERAERRAEWIIEKNAVRTAARKAKLSTAQTLLPLDGLPDEEPVSKFEQDPEIPF